MILFYRRGGLGDTLLTFPLLEILKKQGNYIIAIGNTDYLKIAKEVGWVDEIYSDFYPQIMKRNFIKKIIFSKNSGLPPFPSKRKWMVDYYLELFNFKKEYSSILPLKYNKDTPFTEKIVIHPGSGSSKKIPPFSLFEKIENFLIQKGFEIIYLIGEADSWIKKFTNNYWECLEPLEIAYALKSAKAYIGLDSGISHLASYLGIKSYIFYGPTDIITWRPIGVNYKIITLNLKCSPCFPKVCKERKCLDPDKLFQRFVKIFI